MFFVGKNQPPSHPSSTYLKCNLSPGRFQKTAPNPQLSLLPL